MWKRHFQCTSVFFKARNQTKLCKITTQEVVFQVLVIGHFRVPKTLTFKMRLGAQTFLWKRVLLAREWKMTSISKAEHLRSFWNRGPGKLGNCLLIYRNRHSSVHYFRLSDQHLYHTVSGSAMSVLETVNFNSSCNVRLVQPVSSWRSFHWQNLLESFPPSSPHRVQKASQWCLWSSEE